MSVICPTVLASNAHSYRSQIERVAAFCHRIQIDLMDGEFAPHKSVDLKSVWWPAGVKADLHIMYQRPNEHINKVVELCPQMAIIHAEANGDFYEFQAAMKAAGIKIGLALLESTQVAKIKPVIDMLDHVLIFSGKLGSFGGRANLDLLEKVKYIKALKPGVEIGWDGGVNQHNVEKLATGGVDVLNVGGYIQRSEQPDKAYATLEELVGKANEQ